MSRVPITRFERLELKFLVDDASRALVVDQLAERMRFDENGDETGRYAVVTLYYDNPQLDIYRERLRGVRYRRKLRVRVYEAGRPGAEPESFLEVKHRFGSKVAKRRARLSVEDALATCAGETVAPVAALDQRVLDEAREMARTRDLRPACVMRYERQAFSGMDDESGLRVTFDENLRYRFRDLVPRPGDDDFDGLALEPGHHVMEVKVDSAMPYWLSLLIGRAGGVLRGVSKYSLAVDAVGASAVAHGLDVPDAILAENSSR